ncbi:hypothetical protein A3A68_02380 [Candidatus Saccharibacteria bacterium RIFCSPLOWO2_01_FULL_48_13]|nr:MAG: hypothetical protein A2884_00110 [Candidatus Saccharibacteria bacterium RIFCSPHIGHO2_01_FULL_48_12]OGL36073.1 MAG: hypothetical protein A3F38_00515 [Candidatus Saccharibacteria bacterium RIFCSPHIGHO2_12_FULL_48_21]OGL36768.1 MAG: hypothetical protein A3A68_02380 [Candidatus Saccharibacteria bacterium RIFCSPLOWO2_01_FULL_48_13]
MINLLPPSYANSIRFGRRNATLRRWISGLGLAVIGLVMILGGGWLYLDNQVARLRNQVEVAESQLDKQNLVKVRKEIQEISTSVKVINKVLSSEVRFSELIPEIGKVLPPGTALTGLTLNSTVGGGLDLTASTVDHQSAAQFAANLRDPKNGLFEAVDIIKVKCTTGGDGPYYCEAVYRTLFSKDTKNKFLNVPKGDSQ